MLKIIKKTLIEKIQNKHLILTNDKDLNIVIQTNSYFTKNNWLLKFDEIIKKNNNFYLHFVKNKFQILRVLNDCDAGFFFDLSNLYINSSTKLKMIYLGITGHEYDSTVNPNIKTYSCKGFSSVSIAEYVLANTIQIVNAYNNCGENKGRKRWDQKPILYREFKRIEDFKIGIMGVGNNGKIISEKFFKLGCNVFGLDKVVISEFPFIRKWFTIEEIKEFLNTIDVLIICISSNEQTKNLIDYDLIKKYLKGKYIINVARGDIIKQKDLIKCLKEKIIAGAVLDVFYKEPLPIFNPLWNFDNVVISPHISGNINRHVSIIQNDFLKKIVDEFKLNDI